MRLFTAIPLPDEIKKKTTELMQGRLPVSYVNAENLHITLNFFGELDQDKIEVVKKVFPDSAAGSASFSIEFGKIVQFRNQIHMTITANSRLTELQERMQKAFEQAGFTFQNHPYYPHVKLSNIHMDNVMFRERKIDRFPNELLNQMSFAAERIVLYRSELLMHHARHSELMDIKL